MTEGQSRLILNDAEELQALYASFSEMRPEYTQLSRGQVQHTFDILELDGVSIVKGRVQGRTRWLDSKMAGDLHFGWCVFSQGGFCAMGTEISRDHAMVWMPGREIEYVMNGPCLTFEMAVSAELIETLGWQFRGHPLQQVGDSALNALSTTCFYLFDLHKDSNWARTKYALRDTLLSELERVLDPWLCHEEDGTEMPDDAHYRIVREADAFLHEYDFSKRLTLDALSDHLAVSRRSIHYAFRKHLNLTPRRYIELLRLHQLRHHLKTARPGETTVSRAALAFHFSDTGRLPGVYRAVFGENPGETLGRSS